VKFVARRPLILSLLFVLALACQACTNAALQMLQSQFDSNPNSPGGSTGGSGGTDKGGTGSLQGPSNLYYAWTNFVFTQNVQIAPAFPEYSGGTPTSYTITPSTLPNGLFFDSSTGGIYGQPSGPPQGNTSYELQAINQYGTAALEFNISIEADDSFRSWTDTPTIPTPTTGVAVAPLFFGGSALIIGGSTAAIGATAATWIYNMSGPINVGPNLNIGRSQMTATVLQTGAILVAGGVDASGNYLSSAELYDPSMNIFTMLGSTMSSGRAGHTATLLEDGTVLLVGGYDGKNVLASADIFNPETNQFTPAMGTLNVARNGHAATLMGNGNVLITGGTDVNGNPYSTGEVYNMPTGGFSMLGSIMSSVRANHISVALPNGQVLVALGASGSYGSGLVTNAADIYDPIEQTFTPTGSAITAAYGSTGILLPNGEVLVVGGAIEGCTPAQASELYNPTTGEWTPTTSTPSYPVNGQAGALLTNGAAFIAGGVNFDCGGDPDPQIPNTSFFQ